MGRIHRIFDEKLFPSKRQKEIEAESQRMLSEIVKAKSNEDKKKIIEDKNPLFYLLFEEK